MHHDKCPQCGADVEVEQSRYKRRVYCPECERYEKIEISSYNSDQVDYTYILKQEKAPV